MTGQTSAVPRRPTALMWDPNFGPFFFGKILSACGIWISNVTAAVLMFELTRSAFMVGVVSVTQFLGPLFLSVWAGSLTDRIDRRRLLMLGRLVSGSSVGVLAILLTTLGPAEVGPNTVLMITLVMGLGLGLSAPAMQAIIPSLVPPADLEQGVALGSAVASIARTVGPALGAGLLLLGGPQLSFGVSACSHLAFAGALLFVRPRVDIRAKVRPALLGGFRYLVTDKQAGWLMLGVTALGLGVDPVVTLTPSLVEALGAEAATVGYLASAFGIGAVVSAFSVRLLRRLWDLRTVGVVGFLFLASGFAIASVSPVVGLAFVGFLIAGSGFMMASTALTTRIQRRVPEDLRGRVMALWSVAFLGSRPIAATFNGAMADLTSVRTALLVAASVTLGSSVFARVEDAVTDDPGVRSLS